MIVTARQRTRSALVVVAVLAAAACGKGSPVGPFPPYERYRFPILQEADQFLVDEVLFTGTPDSTWAISPDRIGFLIRVPGDSIPAVWQGHTLDLLAVSHTFAELLVALYPAVAAADTVRWYRGPIGGVWSVLEYYLPLPAGVQPEAFLQDGLIRGELSRQIFPQPLRVRIVSKRTAYEWRPIVPVYARVAAFAPGPAGVRVLVRAPDRSVFEIDASGNRLPDWLAPFPSNGLDTAAWQNGLLILLKRDTGTRLVSLGPSDAGPSVVAEDDSLELVGIELKGDTLFGLARHMPTGMDVLWKFDMNLLVSTGSFAAARPEYRVLDFSLRGPLMLAAGGLLLGQTPGDEGEGIALFDTLGVGIGQWTVPFPYTLQACFDGTALYLDPGWSLNVVPGIRASTSPYSPSRREVLLFAGIWKLPVDAGFSSGRRSYW